jgi:nitrous oxidase accessory protein
MKKNAALVIALLSTLFLSLWIGSFSSAKISPSTIVVPDDYPTIQEAVDNATAGDKVFVKNGVYYEQIVIDKPISLIGEDSQKTVIAGDRFHYSDSAIEVDAGNVTISGFTIRDYFYPPAISVGVLGKLPVGVRIVGNNIENNSVGIRPFGQKDPTTGLEQPANLIISGNNITQNGQGIYCDTSNVTISANNITGNGLGIGIADAVNVTITGNTIKSNGISGSLNDSGGLRLTWYGPFYVYGNDITDNQGYGVQFDSGCNNSTVHDNNIERNLIGINLFNFLIDGDSTIGSGNIVYHNNLVDNSHQVFIEKEGRYAANFNYTYANGTDIVSWDNGKEGNYWSDYIAKYPNAREIDSSGIGDIPYVIDANNIDNYPIMQPVTTSTVTPSPPTPSPPSTLALIVPGVVVVVAVLAVAVLVYWRKQKSNRLSKATSTSTLKIQ